MDAQTIINKLQQELANMTFRAVVAEAALEEARAEVDA
jgi:hypothetical protein